MQQVYHAAVRRQLTFTSRVMPHCGWRYRALRWSLIRWRHVYTGNNDGQEDNAESSVDEGRGAHDEIACAREDKNADCAET
jgi:hypothetical protein